MPDISCGPFCSCVIYIVVSVTDSEQCSRNIIQLRCSRLYLQLYQFFLKIIAASSSLSVTCRQPLHFEYVLITAKIFL